MLNLNLAKNDKKELVVVANREGFERPYFITEAGNMDFHNNVFKLSDWSFLRSLEKKEEPTEEDKLKIKYLKSEGVTKTQPLATRLEKLVCIGLNGFRGTYGVPENFVSLYNLALSHRVKYLEKCESWTDERKQEFNEIREKCVSVFYQLASADTNFNKEFKLSITSGNLNLWLEKLAFLSDSKEGSKKAKTVKRGITVKKMNLENAFRWYCSLILVSSGLKQDGKKTRLVDMVF